MKHNPIKLCREPWSNSIQHLPSIKSRTRAAGRKLRHNTKIALKNGSEPPYLVSGGDRY